MTVINLSPQVALKLETITTQMNGKEFSGIGFASFADGNFEIYDVILISVGSEVYTEIPSKKLLPILDRPDARNMKVWFHRHGVGNGIPGQHNWSGTDTKTARMEPLGCPIGMAHLVKWSLSIVRTPLGWVGRYDTYGDKGETAHLRVEPSMAQSIIPEIDNLWGEYNRLHGKHISFAELHNSKYAEWKNLDLAMANLGDDEQADADFYEANMDEIVLQVKAEIDGMGYREALNYIEDYYPYLKSKAKEITKNHSLRKSFWRR